MATKKKAMKISIANMIKKYKELSAILYKINDSLLERAYKHIIKEHNLDKKKIFAYYFPDAEEGEIGEFEILYDDTFSIIIESQNSNSNDKITYYVRLRDL